MARLLSVLLLSFIAFTVAAYSWNATPNVECSREGLEDAIVTFNALAEKRPRRAADELRKLSARTRAQTQNASIRDLVTIWNSRAGGPDPRVCVRLRESFARLS